MARSVKEVFARLRGGRREPEPELVMPAHRLTALRTRGMGTGDDSAGLDEAPMPGAENDTADFPAAPPSAEEPAPLADPGLQPIVLARRIRELGSDWHGASSWFGGLPSLGEAPWPRNAQGTPLPFAAQIDLADIAAVRPETPLPRTGSLAFFLDSGAVIFVPEGARGDTPAPADLPPAFDRNEYPFQAPSLLSDPVFPYWPVEPIPIDLPERLRDNRHEDLHDDIWEALQAAVSARLGRREYALGATSLAELCGLEALPVWWDGANHFITTLKQALAEAPALMQQRLTRREQARLRVEETEEASPEREQAQSDLDLQDAVIRRAEAQIAGLPALIQALDGFAADRDPWDVLTAEEEAVLADALVTARRQFDDAVFTHPVFKLGELSVLSLRRMMTGDERAIAAMPAAVLAAINRDYRLPSQGLQQMFGLGSSIQNALYEHEGDVLLLQLHYDDMMEWRFGDMGAFQFWISLEDLAAERWDRATMTFECG